jgi:hypothetical protein
VPEEPGGGSMNSHSPTAIIKTNSNTKEPDIRANQRTPLTKDFFIPHPPSIDPHKAY